MSETKDKYKMFLQFMHNELGISKDDIREWVEEAIERQVAIVVKDWQQGKVLDRALARVTEKQAREWGLEQKVVDSVGEKIIEEFRRK